MADQINAQDACATQAEADRVRALALASLNYDPDTGVLTWKVRRAQRIQVGAVAGSVCAHHGYVDVRLEKRPYKAHRLIWLMVHGVWPPNDIDHANGRRDDNSLANLRLATRPQNSANMRVKRAGLKGAYWFKRNQRWCSRLGKEHLGYFDTEQAAHEAYMKAARAKYGEFARAA